MIKHTRTWLVGLISTLALIVVPLLIFIPRQGEAADSPGQHLPVRPPHTDHSALLPGPYSSGSEVTQTCLECHPLAADQVMGTTHWTWESEPYQFDRLDQQVTLGKATSLNNFCIGVQSNWPDCTSCHIGYGWADESFDFSEASNVDCLICHADSGTYAKSTSGYPAEAVDLAVAAQSVGWPTSENCGGCHFNGGGGNAVKHGDMDQHLYFPTAELDVHMGGQGMVCTDCHQTDEHAISGRMISINLGNENQVSCIDCHSAEPHADQRLDAHTDSVACQTCHIPEFAVTDPTKVYWDWSTAGQDRIEDVHEFLRIKGSFIYEDHVQPEYYWFSGTRDRYLLGDVIDPSQPTLINTLQGDIGDAQARIFPFKIHRALQPYDAIYNYLLQPKVAGEGGFWTEFDWELALTLGSEVVDLPYSGQYGFAETWMYLPITHTVQPTANALGCEACHSPGGRLDWTALGYPGDPMQWGGRSQGASD